MTTSLRVEGTSIATTVMTTTTATPISSALGEGSLMLPNASRPAQTRNSPARATWPTTPAPALSPTAEVATVVSTP